MVRLAFSCLALLCWFCCSCNGEVAPVWHLDLTGAVHYALDHNKNLANAALAVDGSEIGVSMALDEFAIHFTPDSALGLSDHDKGGRYGLTAEKKSPWGTIYGVGANAEQNVADNDWQRAAIKVEVRQPLFRNFGPTVNYEGVLQSQDALKSQRRSWEEQKAGLIVDVVRFFEDILRLQRQVKADEGFYLRTDKLYRLTKAREMQGKSTRVDTLRVELQRSQAVLSLENDKEQLTVVCRDFADLLGVPLDSGFDLVPPPLLEVAVPDLEVAVQIALSNRLDYAQAWQDYASEVRLGKIAKRGLYPNVNLTARDEQCSEGDEWSRALTFSRNNWFVGMTADTDLNQSQARARISQSKINLAMSERVIEIKALSVAREVGVAISNYRRTRADLLIAERNYELARRRSELARRLYQLGRGDNFSVTDADSAAMSAEDQLLGLRAVASISGYELLRTLGVLVDFPSDLKFVGKTK